MTWMHAAVAVMFALFMIQSWLVTRYRKGWLEALDLLELERRRRSIERDRLRYLERVGRLRMDMIEEAVRRQLGDVADLFDVEITIGGEEPETSN